MSTKEKIRPALNISCNLSASGKFNLWSIAAILLLTLIVYGNSLNNDFTNWDDPGLVIDNTAITSLSLENILNVFTPRAGYTYQPVRVLSYAIDYHFWQLDPFGYHLGNTLLHLLAAVILYFLLATILEQMGEQSPGKSVRTTALLAVLLFVVHPVNVESVAWVASRKYGLLTFFTFLSFYLYLKSAQADSNRILLYLFSTAAYILALLSSPFAVVLPGLIILYDFCRSSRSKSLDILKSRWRYYILYIFLGFAQFLLLMQMVSTGPNPTLKEHHAGKALYTLLTMIRVLYDYLRNLLIPIWLNNRYIDKVSSSLFEYKVIISIAFLIFIFILVFRQLKSDKKIFIFCFGWFFISLFPVSNIIPISTKMADRYLYLPAVGLFLLFSVGLHNLAEISFGGKFKRVIILSVSLPLLFPLSYLSVQRNKVWANSQTLWEDSLRKAPNSPLAHLSLGEALHQQKRWDEAINHYLYALQLKPDYHQAYNNLATVLAEQGNFAAAAEQYQKALEIKPDDAGIHNNFATSLAQQGKTDQAIVHYSRALEIRPDFAEVYSNLGNVFKQQDKIDKAIAHYSKALEIKPNQTEAHNNLGVLLAKRGRLKEAVNHYSEALRLNPDSAEIHNNLAVALVELGEIEAAIPHYAKALDLRPDYAEAHNNLGNAFSEQGRLKEAVARFTKALEIRPHYPEAQNNLGVALARQGRLNEAIAHFNEALRLNPDYVQARANLELALQMMSKADKAAVTKRNP